MKKILLMQRMDEAGMKILADAGLQVDIPEDTSEEGLKKIVPEYDGIIVRGMVKLPGPVIDAAVNCKVIGRHGVGLETIDVAAATKNNIPVVFTPGANANAVAEEAVSLMLDVMKRNCLLSDKLKRQKDYSCRLKVMNSEMMGKTLGLIGLGNIGRRVAEICGYGFKMNVVGHDPFLTQEKLDELKAPVKLLESVDEVIRQADVLSLHAPGSAEKLIGARELEMMKQGSILVNTARGSLIDEKALYAALTGGRLMGAGLDVTEQEPPDPDNPLFTLDNVVATPHTAALTKEGNQNMAKGVAEQIVAVLKGSKTWGLVNGDIWDSRRK